MGKYLALPVIAVLPLSFCPRQTPFLIIIWDRGGLYTLSMFAVIIILIRGMKPWPVLVAVRRCHKSDSIGSFTLTLTLTVTPQPNQLHSATLLLGPGLSINSHERANKFRQVASGV